MKPTNRTIAPYAPSELCGNYKDCCIREGMAVSQMTRKLELAITFLSITWRLHICYTQERQLNEAKSRQKLETTGDLRGNTKRPDISRAF